MKKDTITKMAMLLCLMCMAGSMMTLTSCGGGDDDGEPNSAFTGGVPGLSANALIGTWCHEDSKIRMEYTFYSDGTAYYSNSNGVTANIQYKVTNIINYKGTWWTGGSSYVKDSGTWKFWIDGDYLTLDGTRYKRVKR